MKPPFNLKQIERRILFIRGYKVMLDMDLAKLYGVSTKRLNEQVKRNRLRFPDDFIIQLTSSELDSLMRSHFATGSKRNIRYRPYAFTEHGAVMLASVLNSSIAVRASVYVVRAFVRMSHLLVSNKELAGRLEKIERKVDMHDTDIRLLVQDIRKLMGNSIHDLPTEPSPKIKGFTK